MVTHKTPTHASQGLAVAVHGVGDFSLLCIRDFYGVIMTGRRVKVMYMQWITAEKDCLEPGIEAISTLCLPS